MRECIRLYLAERREEYANRIAEIKMRRGCAICGFAKAPAALEFHHHFGPKAFSLSLTGASRSWESIVEEMSKCVVLCCNCHRLLHMGPDKLREPMLRKLEFCRIELETDEQLQPWKTGRRGRPVKRKIRKI